MAASIALPDIKTVKLPQLYQNAKRALAACTKVDECQDWANKAEAIATYAKMARDPQMHQMADRIQARAIRRMGDLLKQIKAGQGARDGKRHPGTDTPLNRTQAAAEAGLSKRQKDTAIRVANLPADLFEKAIESENPPTVTQLAEAGKKPKVRTVSIVDLEGIPPEDYKVATTARGLLLQFAEFCGKHDPVLVAHAFKKHETPAIRRAIETLDLWVDRFVTNLTGG